MARRLPRTKLTERNEKLLRMYMSGSTKQEVGKRFGITRERVRQIVRDVTGYNTPVLCKDILARVNWRMLNRLRSTFHITRNEVAKATYRSLGTVAHTLVGTKNYILTPAALDVLVCTLELITIRLDDADRCLNELVKE